MTEPGPLDDPGNAQGIPARRVPVLRIFGDSSLGQKACVHIHQVWPYFYVEYLGPLNPDSVNRYTSRLHFALNAAIGMSLSRDHHKANGQFVRAIVLVKGVHFYGFKTGYSPFLKIMLTTPEQISRAILILQSGSVMGKRMNVFESHLSYPLQFMCDFNLYGCSWIDLKGVHYRRSLEEEEDSENPLYHPVTTMPLELDVVSYNILNRLTLKPRMLHHKLEIPAPLPSEERLVTSVRELWEDEKRRRLSKGLDPSPQMPLFDSDDRGTGGDWISKARFQATLDSRIEEERAKEPPVVPSKSWETWVMTTFESIQALWERPHKTWQPSDGRDSMSDEANPFNQTNGAANLETKMEIDEAVLNSQALENEIQSFQEDDQWQKWHEEQEGPEGRLEEEEYPADIPHPEVQWETPIKPAQTSAADNGVKDDTDSHTHPHSPQEERTPTNSNGHELEDEEDRTPTPTRSSYQNTNSMHNLYEMDNTAGSPSSALPHHRSNGKSPVDAFHQDHVSTAPNEIKHETPSGLLAIGVSPSSFNRKSVTDGNKEGFPVLLFQNGDHPKAKSHSQHSTGPTALVVMEDIFFTPTPDHQGRDEQIGSKTPVREDITMARHKPDVSPPSFDTSQSPLRKSGVRFASTTALQHQDRHKINPTSAKKQPLAWEYVIGAPTTKSILDSWGPITTRYRDPHYSNPEDVPEHGRFVGDLLFHLEGGDGFGPLEEWTHQDDDPVPDPQSAEVMNMGGAEFEISTDAGYIAGWEYASMPPSRRVVIQWLQRVAHQEALENSQRAKRSQIEGPTQHNTYVPRYRPPADPTSQEYVAMSILSMELFVPTANAACDPASDEIVAIAWSFQDGGISHLEGDRRSHYRSGIMTLGHVNLDQTRLRDLDVQPFEDEADLINTMIDEVRDLDPDILVGWEVQASSWGYFMLRAKGHGIDVKDLLGRAPSTRSGPVGDNWGVRHTSTLKITGRHVLNIWRLMRSELTLAFYTFHNVVRHVLKQKVPYYANATLKNWYLNGTPAQCSRLLSYFSDMTCMLLEILDETQAVTKASEFARVFGIDFFSVLSRGSQFKVESFMLRIAKPESFVLLSPSKSQVGQQNAAECIPLVMEPESAFYKAPLLVLDFQSLYPSIMVAYNYCYSTCLGRIKEFKGKNRFGVLDHLDIPAGLLEKLKGHLNVAPNGMIYVKPTVRKSLLAKMLTEILDTRVMVKQGMKLAKDNKALMRTLEARQLSLKFIANVTYGYTSATFSGRMPAVEVADSIVQSGRETLEKAIRMIEANPQWNAKVVYGDTDSIFCALGSDTTKEQAFVIGSQIEEAVTAANPAPIRLKFEKVYLPSVLVAKKRYVGFKYEHPDETEPVFDAKGIETVRRDGIPAGQKMLEATLKMLFRSQDLSEIKEFCWRSWTKVLEGRVSIQDFIFAQEVRLGTYSDKVGPPPGAAIAAARLSEDPNDETQYGERVRYVITRAGPGEQLRHRAVPPEVLLFDNSGRQLDAIYYITRRLIPPLSRIFNLVGADVQAWFDEMPRSQKVEQGNEDQQQRNVEPPKWFAKKRGNDNPKIDNSFVTHACLSCGSTTTNVICSDCRNGPEATMFDIMSHIRKADKRRHDCQLICTSCSGSAPAEAILCESLECEWLYERVKANKEYDKWQGRHSLVSELNRRALGKEDESKAD